MNDVAQAFGDLVSIPSRWGLPFGAWWFIGMIIMSIIYKLTTFRTQVWIMLILVLVFVVAVATTPGVEDILRNR